MEESFPRGGKRSRDSKPDEGGPVSKRKKGTTKEAERAEDNSKSRAEKFESRSQLAALWTGKLATEICVTDLLVLGCVRTITDHCVLLELPDGLQGILSLENISSVLTRYMLRQNQNANETDEVNLNDYFTRGQLICCKIIPTKSDTKKDNRKRHQQRLHLTTDPEQVNSTLSLVNYVNGMMLNGAVRSIEENGYIIDLGLSTSVGFLPYDHCGFGQSGADGERLKMGQVLTCAVMGGPNSEDTSAARVIRLSTLPVHLNGTSEYLEQYRSKEQYSPGLVLNSMVEKVLPSKGIIVRLAKPGGGCWRGFVSRWKLQNPTYKPTDYKPEQSLKVAVLYSIPNSTVFGLSAQSHLTNCDPNGRTDLLQFGTVGDLVAGSVKSTTAKGGVFFQLDAGKRKGTIIGQAAAFQLEKDGDDQYAIGSKHRLRIIGYSLLDRLFHVDARKSVFKDPVVDVESCVPGTLVQATVRKVTPDRGIHLRVCDRVNGFAQPFQCYDAPTVKKLDQKFSQGQTVKARILRADMEKNRIILTLKKKLVSSSLRPVNSFDPSYIGQKADGFVVQINAERGVLVAFYGKARGWLSKRELEKHGVVSSETKLTHFFSIGQTVRIQISHVDPSAEKMLLSPVAAKRATGEAEKENAPAATPRPAFVKKCSMAVGTLYTATVTKVCKMQLNVLIEKQHEGRVFITELSDKFAHGSMPLADYSVGQSVLVKVIAIRRKRRKRKKTASKDTENEALGAEEATKKKTFQFAECTMKESKLKAKSAKKRVIGYKDTFRKGQRVAAVVEEFARRDAVGYCCHAAVNPTWKAVVPILQLSADLNELRSPMDHFTRGQVIVGRVTGIQGLEKHLQLTCLSSNQSIIAPGEKTRVVVTELGTDIKCTLVDGTSGFMRKQNWNETVDIKPGDTLEARPVGKVANGKWKLAATIGRSKVNGHSEVKVEPVDEEKVEVPRTNTNEVSEAAGKMEQASRFSWSSGRFSMANLMGVCLGEESGEKEIKRERGAEKGAIASGSTFERERVEEDHLFQKEMALLHPEGETQSSDDFDRLVMGSPDSSLIWIRYMAFFLQKGDVSKARAVAQRSLKTISVREENERFNVWTALLNLECAYGTNESFRETLDEAIVVNDPLKVYQLAAKILRKSSKIEECDALFEEMLSKFKSEFNVWISFADYCMTTSRADKARDLMRRAMRSLPQARHVDLVSRFAQLEYRYSMNTNDTVAVGDAERGRTLFENILRDYPKRTDVWSVYIDMTTKYQGIDQSRPLLERVMSMKMNVHNTRLFYKKWLDLEERLGTQETLGQVKKRAAEYVKGSLAMLPGSSKMDEEDAESFV